MVFALLGLGVFFGGAALYYHKKALTHAKCPKCTDEEGTHYPEVYLDDDGDDVHKAKRGKPCVCCTCGGKYIYNGSLMLLSSVPEDIREQFPELDLEEDDFKEGDVVVPTPIRSMEYYGIWKPLKAPLL